MTIDDLFKHELDTFAWEYTLSEEQSYRTAVDMLVVHRVLDYYTDNNRRYESLLFYYMLTNRELLPYDTNDT